MQVAILFFSGTGNTWWITKEIGSRLESNGCSVALYSIENVSLAQINSAVSEADLVGFGYPIYGSDVPQIMKDCMAQIDFVAGKKAFVFCTQWLYSGDGARVGAAFVDQRGFDVRWGEHFLMPNNVCVPLVPFLPFTSDVGRMQGQLRRAKRRIVQFVACIVSGRPLRRGFTLAARLQGALQRVPFRRSFSAWRDRIGVDRGRCTACLQCVKLCPADNFRFVDGRLETVGRCILCLRCYNFCPVSAVTFSGRSHDLKRGIPFRGPVTGFNPHILKTPTKL